MIRLEAVSKYFATSHGRNYVLKDISVSFPDKVNIGILGLNGSGKSTLLRLLGGIDYPNKGSINIDSNVSWPIGLSGGLQPNLTGEENSKFVCMIYGEDKNIISEKLKYIVFISELEDYFYMPVSTYSSGMRARLKFAISMAFDFDVYLFDEINAVGDARFRKKSRQILNEKKSSSNYIMVSHNPNDLIRDCDMLAVLDNGHMEIFENVRRGIRIYQKNIAA